jgi:integrase
MPRKAEELGALAVAAINEPGRHAVGGVAGLCLQVLPADADKAAGRSWVLRVMIAGKRKEIGLGGFPDVPLKDARAKAREFREAIDKGLDPAEERKAAKARLLAEAGRLLTFEQAAKDYLAAHEREWTGKAHRRQWFYMLEELAVPVIGKMAVGDIETTHALGLLRPLWSEKTETAQRLRARCESVLNAAKAAGAIRDGSWGNPFRWRGHLDGLLAKPSKLAPVVHHKALPSEDMSGFMAALRQRDGTAARTLEFMVLCAVRSGEARGATWAELDLNTKVWTIPKARMKADREHRVPLSQAAVALLNKLPRIGGCELVFAGPSGKPISDVAVSKLCRDLTGGRGVPHGVARSTFRDWAGDCTSYPRDLCEAALAHKVGGTEGAYRRSDAVERRRPLMADWAKFLAKPAAKKADGEDGNVRELRAAQV